MSGVGVPLLLMTRKAIRPRLLCDQEEAKEMESVPITTTMGRLPYGPTFLDMDTHGMTKNARPQ
jgi:hypothetical protein